MEDWYKDASTNLENPIKSAKLRWSHCKLITCVSYSLISSEIKQLDCSFPLSFCGWNVKSSEIKKKTDSITSVLQPYLHESRHQHALKRARGAGGRFLNSKSDDKEENSDSSHKERQNGVAPQKSCQPSTPPSPNGASSANQAGSREWWFRTHNRRDFRTWR